MFCNLNSLLFDERKILELMFILIRYTKNWTLTLNQMWNENLEQECEKPM